MLVNFLNLQKTANKEKKPQWEEWKGMLEKYTQEVRNLENP